MLCVAMIGAVVLYMVDAAQGAGLNLSAKQRQKINELWVILPLSINSIQFDVYIYRVEKSGTTFSGA